MPTYTYAGRYSDRFQNRFGNAVPALTVKVYTSAALTTLATIYNDRLKTASIPNPSATDADGNLTFFAVPGTYWLVAVDLGVAQPAIEVSVPVDPADAVEQPSTIDSAALVPTGGTTGQSLVKASGANYDTTWSTISGGSGTSDHGLLLGLADNDHPQYTLATTTTALDTRVGTAETNITGLRTDVNAAVAVNTTQTTNINTVTNEVTTARGAELTLNDRFADHASSISNLTATKEDVGVAATGVTNHKTEVAPHAGYSRMAIYNSSTMLWTLADGTAFTPLAGITTIFKRGTGDPEPVVGTGSGNARSGDIVIDGTV